MKASILKEIAVTCAKWSANGVDDYSEVSHPVGNHGNDRESKSLYLIITSRLRIFSQIYETETFYSSFYPASFSTFTYSFA